MVGLGTKFKELSVRFRNLLSSLVARKLLLVSWLRMAFWNVAWKLLFIARYKYWKNGIWCNIYRKSILQFPSSILFYKLKEWEINSIRDILYETVGHALGSCTRTDEIEIYSGTKEREKRIVEICKLLYMKLNKWKEQKAVERKGMKTIRWQLRGKQRTTTKAGSKQKNAGVNNNVIS